MRASTLVIVAAAGAGVYFLSKSSRPTPPPSLRPPTGSPPTSVAQVNAGVDLLNRIGVKVDGQAAADAAYLATGIYKWFSSPSQAPGNVASSALASFGASGSTGSVLGSTSADENGASMLGNALGGMFGGGSAVDGGTTISDAVTGFFGDAGATESPIADGIDGFFGFDS